MTREPEVIDSGILGLDRAKDEPFQDYKMRLIGYWGVKSPWLLYEYRPVRIVVETQPAVGGGNYTAATQSELAKVPATIILAGGAERGLGIDQIGATTVKSRVAGSKDASKAKVRNAVISHFPKLGPELRKESTGKPAMWDRADALAIGLAYLQML